MGAGSWIQGTRWAAKPPRPRRPACSPPLSSTLRKSLTTWEPQRSIPQTEGGGAHRNALERLPRIPCRTDAVGQHRAARASGRPNELLPIPLGGVVHLTPGDNQPTSIGASTRYIFEIRPGGRVDQVDRREYSGSTHAQSARL